ncbi:MAG: hypothetical protein U5J63_07970 [Fodinibius sp.]|nr:hypothetical protein [Fodinibius sp.]
MHINHDEMYAVMNRNIRQRSKMGYPRRYVKNKVKRYYNELKWFRTQFLNKDTFREAIPLIDDGWYEPDEEQVYRVPGEANELVFGNGETKKVPHEGMKAHGPYRPPSHKHIRILFIVHAEDRKEVANKLYGYLKKGKGYFPGCPPTPMCLCSL